MQGEQRFVEVRGVFSNGFEMGVLTDPACPSEHTWLELDLQSESNKETLRSTLRMSGAADVLLDGEFFGPGIPDPGLPDSIKKSYRPGWGHLGAFRTKLVVHAIKSVAVVRADHQAGTNRIAPIRLLLDLVTPTLMAIQTPTF
jgi:hypothetical protein